jgi:uncharacterized cupin superfamily protein
MKPPILNIADLDYHPWGHGERYAARIGAIGSRLGAQKLGYNVTVLPPGKRAYPRHNHHVNEEMFFILEGDGEVAIGDTRHPIRSGDIIACPPGGPETAHQIVNTSATTELKFLAVSTRISPEVAEYPDSGKYGILAEAAPGPDGQPRILRFITRAQATVDDYWQGE